MLNFQNIWCLIKTQFKNITQNNFQGGSPWATLIHNSLVCLGVHYCVQLLPEVMFFFQPFPFPFPLLKFVSFYLASFFLESKPKAFQRISFSQVKKHEWSWYTIVWFVWGYTIVSSCFLRWLFFSLLESKLKSIASKLKSIESNLKWIWSWYTIVWFVWGYTIVSSCFLRWFCFFLHSLYIFLC